MSTWLDDLKRTNPKLAAAYGVVGNQDSVCLRNMVAALSSLSILNTSEDNKRLAAAKYILASKRQEREISVNQPRSAADCIGN